MPTIVSSFSATQHTACPLSIRSNKVMKVHSVSKPVPIGWAQSFSRV